MMHNYEHTIITKQDLSETQTKKVINKYEDLIKANAGEIIKTEQWGLRNFSHLIKKIKKVFISTLNLKEQVKLLKNLKKLKISMKR